MAGSYVATDLCEQPGDDVLEIVPIPKLENRPQIDWFTFGYRPTS